MNLRQFVQCLLLAGIAALLVAPTLASADSDAPTNASVCAAPIDPTPTNPVSAS